MFLKIVSHIAEAALVACIMMLMLLAGVVLMSASAVMVIASLVHGMFVRKK